MTGQCEAAVWRRDTYRLKRGYGFRLHYNHGKCKRQAKRDGLCEQHAKQAEEGINVLRFDRR